MKYRIVEYTNPLGDKRYRVQGKGFGLFCSLFWGSVVPYEYDKDYDTFEDAMRVVEYYKSQDYKKTKVTNIE